MLDSLLVSAIMPVYNGEKYISKAIKSVLSQSYTNWELIVVNDGSTDNTASIVLSEEDPRIRYIFQENQGLGEARNAGICAAKGEYIALLDSDDTWESSYLKNMIALLNMHSDAAAVYSGFQYLNGLGEPVGHPNIKIVDPEEFHDTLIFAGNWLIPSAVVFRKRMVEEVGLFDGSLLGVEDTDYWIRLSSNHVFVGLPEALVNYRIHETNMSKDPEHMMTGSLRLTEKQYGKMNGDVHSWPESKRMAYAMFLRHGIRSYLSAGHIAKSADYLMNLLDLAPELTQDMALWRMIARVHLPVEFRNDPAAQLNWGFAQKDIENLLSESEHRKPQLKKQVSKIRGTAFLALAEEAVIGNELIRAYMWLWRIVIISPSMLLTRPYWGTISRSIISILN